MKHLYKGMLFLALLLDGCNCSGPENREAAWQNGADTSMESSRKDTEAKTISEPVVVPIEDRKDINPQAKETMKTRMNESPFSDLGCCEEEINQVKKCCCQEVLAVYEKMIHAKDKRLAKLNMEDPILNNCKNGYLKKDFERLDFGEDDEDELW